MNIVLTGGTGLFSINYARFNEKNNIFLIKNKTECLEFKDRQYKLNLADVEIDVCINAAAITNVENCEKNKEHTYYVNVLIARNIAKACSMKSVKLIQISTDHIFGDDKLIYSEEDEPRPLNYYARTKLLAEECVKQICKDSLIIRTNFFGYGMDYRASFSDIILSGLKQGNMLYLFKDVFFNPVHIKVLVKCINYLINNNKNGIFNISADNRVSKYEFGISVAEVFGFNKNLILPVSILNQKNLVKRPFEMSLHNMKYIKESGLCIGSVEKNILLLLK